MKCPNCGAEIANDSVFCENCGAKVAKKSHKALWGCIGIVLCIAVVGCVFLTKSGSSQDDYVLDRPTYDTEHNPIVNRLSDREISQDRTPAAIAYNFVLAISHEDWDKMESYLTDDGYYWLESEVGNINPRSYRNFFSKSGSKYDILGWKPYLRKGYEVAVLYVQNDAEGFRDGYEHAKVYVHCVPSSQIGKMGFQDIERCNDANPKVMLTKYESGWKVEGFK